MPFQRTLPHVDPRRHQSPAHRALMRMAATNLVAVLESALPARLTVWRLAPILMRVTGGRFARLIPLPVGVIETRNPNNDRPHRRVVIYFHDGDRVVVIPSKSGLPTDPHWYRNALAEPDVCFERKPYRAEAVTDEGDEARIWARAEQLHPAFATYRRRAAKSGRVIPLLQLAPRA